MLAGSPSMEYVILRSIRPTWLTMQLPDDAAELLRYRGPSSRADIDRTGSISFVARGSGIARVVATHLAREPLAVEQVRDRLIASARPGDRKLFSIPSALVEYLGLTVEVRGPRMGRRTNDQMIWFVPASEYYDFRAAEGAPTGWKGPSLGGMAHVYVAKAMLPGPRSLAGLAELESQIETEDWTRAVEALQRGRPVPVRVVSAPRLTKPF